MGVFMEGGQWNRSIWKKLNEMRKSGVACDIELTSDEDPEKRYAAHVCILAAASPYLKTQLHGLGDVYHGTVIHFQFSCRILECILEFMYAGCLAIEGEPISEVEKAAKDLQMRELQMLCTKITRKQGSNANAEHIIMLDNSSWNRNIWNTLNDFRANKQFCNLTMEIDAENSYHVHACLLLAASNYIRKNFPSDKLEDGLTICLKLNDLAISSAAMASVLDFIYTGSFFCQSKDLTAVISLATVFKMDEFVCLLNGIQKHQFVAATDKGHDNEPKVESMDTADEAITVPGTLSQSTEALKQDSSFKTPNKVTESRKKVIKPTLGLQSATPMQFTTTTTNQDVRPTSNTGAPNPIILNQTSGGVNQISEGIVIQSEDPLHNQLHNQTFTLEQNISNQSDQPQIQTISLKQHKLHNATQREVSNQTIQHIVIDGELVQLIKQDHVESSYTSPTNATTTTTTNNNTVCQISGNEVQYFNVDEVLGRSQVVEENQTAVLSIEGAQYLADGELNPGANDGDNSHGDVVYYSIEEVETETDVLGAQLGQEIFEPKKKDNPDKLWYEVPITKLAPYRKLADQQGYACVECGKQNKQKSAAINHSVMHSEERPYVCKVCGMRFKHRPNIIQHVKGHSNVKPFQCRICSKTFSRPYDMRCHERTHTKEKPYKCPHCDKAFAQISNRVSHIKRLHSAKLVASASNLEPGSFECLTCGKHFISSRSLNQHINTHDPLRQKIACETCGVTFASQYSLEKHKKRGACEKNMAENKYQEIQVCEGPQECLHCKQIFDDFETLRDHILSVCSKSEGAKGPDYFRRFDQFICFGCAMPFKTFVEFREHIETGSCELVLLQDNLLDTNDEVKMSAEMYRKSGSKVVCSACNVSFISVQGLKRHKKRGACNKNLRKKTLQFSEMACSTCGDEFKTPAALKKHKCQKDVAHCTGCKTNFPNSRVLFRHQQLGHCIDSQVARSGAGVRKQKGIKPYSCSRCGLAFTSLEMVKKHKSSACSKKATADPESRVACRTCGKWFRNSHQLQEHKKLCTHSTSIFKTEEDEEERESELSKVYTCGVCQLVANSYETLLDHVKICARTPEGALYFKAAVEKNHERSMLNTNQANSLDEKKSSTKLGFDLDIFTKNRDYIRKEYCAVVDIQLEDESSNSNSTELFRCLACEMIVMNHDEFDMHWIDEHDLKCELTSSSLSSSPPSAAAEPSSAPSSSSASSSQALSSFYICPFCDYLSQLLEEFKQHICDCQDLHLTTVELDQYFYTQRFKPKQTADESKPKQKTEDFKPKQSSGDFNMLEERTTSSSSLEAEVGANITDDDVSATRTEVDDFKVMSSSSTGSLAKTVKLLLSCAKCNKGNFKNITEAQKHAREVHGTEGNLCKICGKMFESNKSLEKHKKSDGCKPLEDGVSISKPLTVRQSCKQCAAGKFPSVEEMIKHMQSHRKSWKKTGSDDQGGEEDEEEEVAEEMELGIEEGEESEKEED